MKTFKDKKKGLDKNPSPIKNYFAWIANLGVVPLFLLAAFLLAPELFFLAALLLFVTHVLETIANLLSSQITKKFNYFKVTVISTIGLSVKAFILTLCVVSSAYADDTEEIILSKGEVTQISTPKLSKYSISNKEVVQYRFDSKKDLMTLKALKLGHAQLFYYDYQNVKRIFDILVINKTLDAKLTALSQIFKKLEIQTSTVGNILILSGEIQSDEFFFRIQKIVNENKNLIINQTKINKELQTKILGLIYKKLLYQNIDYISCEFANSGLECRAPDNEKVPDSIQKYFEENFAIKLLSYLPEQKRNLNIKFKIVQLEQLNGEEIRLGLEQLNTSLGEILKTPISKIVEKNSFILKENNVSLSTLAEPMMNAQIRANSIMQIGSDIGFKTYDKEKNITATDWKFAGLKIKFFIDQVRDKFKINYETELSKPNDLTTDSISTNKGESVILSSLNSPIKLFEITLKTSNKSNDAFPLISKIPILGELFKSKSNTDNYKTLTVILEITESSEGV